jgi:hypothetical protein
VERGAWREGRGGRGVERERREGREDESLVREVEGKEDRRIGG